MTEAKNLEINPGDNFVVGFDVSASMGVTDCPGGIARIEFAKERAKLITGQASEHDADGVEFYTFGHQVTKIGLATTNNVAKLINPLQASESMTRTDLLINQVVQDHRARRAAGNKDQTVLFIFTDGEPSEREETIQAIVDLTREFPKKDFCIGFLTVGKVSSELEAFLRDIDDNLVDKYKAAYDCVDVRPLEEVKDFFTAFNVAVND